MRPQTDCKPSDHSVVSASGCSIPSAVFSANACFAVSGDTILFPVWASISRRVFPAIRPPVPPRHGSLRSSAVFALSNFGGRRFGKHVEHQLQIGHVVAQAFGFQSLVLLVLARGHTRPAQRNNIGQRGVFLSLFDTAAFPFVGQFLAYSMDFSRWLIQFSE